MVCNINKIILANVDKGHVVDVRKLELGCINSFFHMGISSNEIQC